MIAVIGTGCGTHSRPGGLDHSFGSGVRLETYHTVAVDRSGRLLVASTPVGRQVGLFFDMRKLVLSRLTPNGKRDQHFGDNGSTTVTTDGWDNTPFAVMQGRDGSITVGLNSTQGHSESVTNGAWSILRFGRNGRPDGSFGSSGLVRVKAQAIGIAAGGMRVLPRPDGGLLLVGHVDVGPAVLIALTRSGQLASNFGHQGGSSSHSGLIQRTGRT
jgi:hypothetical protein